MSRPKKSVPAYCLHRPSGQARVIINGEHIYLGKFDSPESREKYARVITETSVAAPVVPMNRGTAGNGKPRSVNELILEYWRFAEATYVKNGKATRALEGIREALRPLRKLYSSTPAAEFGPRKLTAVRQQMIADNLSRGVVNARIGRIKRMFQWAVSEELVPPSTHHALQAVAGLRYGRCGARETEPVRPVFDLHVAAVLPFLTPYVAAMVLVQRLSGMRAGELVIMRPTDIDRSGPVWVYEPYDHKGKWRGHRKLIPLGPEVQRILAPYMHRGPQEYLFSPRESEQWRLEHRPPYQGKMRKTPIYPSELRRREKIKNSRRRRKSKRPKGVCYNTASYRRAIEYGLQAAKKAGFAISHWHPHQLRHTRGTEVRRLHGVEAAQATLGHAHVATTEIYAAKNLDAAMQIAEELG